MASAETDCPSHGAKYPGGEPCALEGAPYVPRGSGRGSGGGEGDSVDHRKYLKAELGHRRLGLRRRRLARHPSDVDLLLRPDPLSWALSSPKSIRSVGGARSLRTRRRTGYEGTITGGYSTESDTKQDRFTSTKPRSVRRSSGITGSARNDSAMNGRASDVPRACAWRWSASTSEITCDSGAAVISPAMGSAMELSTRPP